MMFCLDVLGAAKFSSVAVKEWSAGWGCGVFYDTFGDSLPFARALLKTGKCPAIRFQIIWEDNHTYSPSKHDRKIVAAIQKLNKLKAEFPSVEIQASPFCEHNIRGAQLRALFQKCDAAARGLVLVNAPLRGDVLPGVVNETHHGFEAPSAQYNFSFDGVACEDADCQKFKNAHQSAQKFFFWSPRFNGKWESNDSTPRPQRKGWPDAKMMRSIIALAEYKGASNLAHRWLYKSHSENKGNGDARAEKPVIICPLKTDYIELVAQGGKVIDRLKYYGTFSDGRYRYYSARWGYEIAKLARAAQGVSLLEVKARGKSYGFINPSFREREYRNAA